MNWHLTIIVTIAIAQVYFAQSIVTTPQKPCDWGPKWTGSVDQVSSPCKARLKLAFVKFHNGSYQGLCCSDKEALLKERKFAQQCNTTMCLVTPEQRRDPCSTLSTKYFIRGKPLRYEAGVEEDCKDPKTGRRGIAVICCPRKSLDRLLLSSQAAEEDEFPHMGSTGSCGCTVYNSEWLISAAHCFVNTSTGDPFDLQKNPVNITLGTVLNNINSTIHSFPVERVIIHPEFSLLRGHPERRNERKRIYNDISLIKLKRRIDFRKREPFIRALPLAPVGFRPREYADQAIILGWGTTGLGTGSQHLQKANLIVRDKDVCFDKERGRYSYASEFKRQFLCLGGIVNGSASGSAGGGDSGGGAICRGKNGEAVLCGVSSFGADVDEDECGEHQTEELCFPSAYDDIGYFRRWIEDNAGRQDERGLYRVKLYGDEDIPRRKYLHQVHITTEDGRRCGGTLVTLDTVVTAGHCVVTDEGRERRGIRIEANVRDLNGRGGREHTYQVRRGRRGIIFPRNFTRVRELDSINRSKSGRLLFLDSPYAYDIAIVKLDRRVEGLRREDLPRLPNQRQFEPGEATEVAFPLDTRRSGRMVKREFRILPRKECKVRTKRFNLIGINARFDSDEVMCGVEKYSGGSTCDRELGGGVLCEERGGRVDVFCGIQTFRTCHMTIPSAFLSVAKYLNFIRREIEQDE